MCNSIFGQDEEYFPLLLRCRYHWGPAGARCLNTNLIILPHCPVCSEQILSFQRAWQMLSIVQNRVSSPVERRQILEEIKPWINLLHVDLTYQCPSRALTAQNCSDLVLSFVLGVLGVFWVLLLCTKLTAHDLYFCFILNCSPLWSSHSKYF